MATKPRNRSWREVSESTQSFRLVFLPPENRYRRVCEEGVIVWDPHGCRPWQAEQSLPLPSKETPPHHLQPQAVGAAGSSLWTKPVSWHLLQRGAGPRHQAQRGSHSGGTAFKIHFSHFLLTLLMSSPTVWWTRFKVTPGEWYQNQQTTQTATFRFLKLL